MEATIRRATVEDARPIAETQVAAWRAAYRDVLPQSVLAELTVDARERMWTAATARDDADVFVAEIDGDVVGFVALGAASRASPHRSVRLWRSTSLRVRGARVWAGGCTLEHAMRLSSGGLPN